MDQSKYTVKQWKRASTISKNLDKWRQIIQEVPQIVGELKCLY